jgi:hypothetical protein
MTEITRKHISVVQLDDVLRAMEFDHTDIADIVDFGIAPNVTFGDATATLLTADEALDYIIEGLYSIGRSITDRADDAAITEMYWNIVTTDDYINVEGLSL